MSAFPQSEFAEDYNLKHRYANVDLPVSMPSMRPQLGKFKYGCHALYCEKAEQVSDINGSSICRLVCEAEGNSS